MKNFLEKNKEWLKMVGVTITAVWTLIHYMHAMELRLNDRIQKVDGRLTSAEKNISEQIHNLDKRMTVVETVLIMQGAPIKAITQAESGMPK